MKIDKRRKLTEADVLRIRSKPRTPEDEIRLGKELGVARQTVWKALNRVTWTHV